jgi:argininosuccinate synthase
MAKFWAGPYPWDKTQYEVTVKTTWYKDRKAWVEEMVKWAKERNMRIEWSGESTHTMDDNHWHQAHFYIPDERDRIAFALRWA